jgi:hypothetical protein
VCCIQTFEICAYGSCIRFKPGDAESLSILDRFVFPSFPRFQATREDADLEICLDEVGGVYRLTGDGVVLSSAPDPIEIVGNLIQAIDKTIVENLTTLRAVHAGVVVWREQAMLFPGSTHAGKSTLVAELLRRGATYFSDEYAMVDPEGFVHPYPRPLLMRYGSPDQRPMLASERNAEIGENAAPISWIFALQYDPRAALTLKEVPQSLALVFLLGNTPHALEQSPDMVSTFRRAVSGARCFAGNRNDAEEAVDQILQLVDSA